MTTEHADKQASEIYEQARGRLREGRIDEAIELLRRVSDRMPRALGELAYTFYARGDFEDAHRCGQQYVERVAEDPNAWWLMARVARARGDLQQAQEHARRAVSLAPNQARLWYELGETLFQAGQWRGAARAYRRCLALDPEHGQARLRCVHARRLATQDRIRAITWRPPVRWVLRPLLASRWLSALLETTTGIALDDRRWRLPLEWEAPPNWRPQCPRDQQPERFAAHFTQCRCPFWQWFQSLRLEGPVRAILEIGLGAGNVAHHFVAAGRTIRSVTPSGLARHDRLRRGIRAAKGDFHFISEKGGTFDLIVAGEALRYSRSPLFALWEWKRLLRPDGYLLILQPLFSCRPAGSPEEEPREAGDTAAGERPSVLTPTYWHLRWLIRFTGFQLIAETLEDPARACLESLEHVDGRLPCDPAKAWNVFFLLRKPGRLPHDRSLEKPRPPRARQDGKMQ